MTMCVGSAYCDSDTQGVPGTCIARGAQWDDCTILNEDAGESTCMMMLDCIAETCDYAQASCK
jgi:hypothetical protein